MAASFVLTNVTEENLYQLIPLGFRNGFIIGTKTIWHILKKWLCTLWLSVCLSVYWTLWLSLAHYVSVSLSLPHNLQFCCCGMLSITTKRQILREHVTPISIFRQSSLISSQLIILLPVRPFAQYAAWQASVYELISFFFLMHASSLTETKSRLKGHILSRDVILVSETSRWWNQKVPKVFVAGNVLDIRPWQIGGDCCLLRLNSFTS